MISLGEFPRSNPSIGIPPISPISRTSFACSFRAKAYSGVATRIDFSIPSENSDGVHVKARKTSIITAVPLARCARAKSLS